MYIVCTCSTFSSVVFAQKPFKPNDVLTELFVNNIYKANWKLNAVSLCPQSKQSRSKPIRYTIRVIVNETDAKWNSLNILFDTACVCVSLVFHQNKCDVLIARCRCERLLTCNSVPVDYSGDFRSQQTSRKFHFHTVRDWMAMNCSPCFCTSAKLPLHELTFSRM